MAKCAGGCGREVPQKGNFCVVCGYGRKPSTSNHTIRRVPLIQEADEDGKDSQPQQLLVSLRGGKSVKMDNGPAYHESTGERVGRVLGPLVGIVIALAIVGFVAAGLMITRTSVEVASQEIARKMEAEAKRKAGSSSSSSSSMSSSVRRRPDYSEVQMSLKAKPESRLKLYIGARSPLYLNVSLGRTGTIRAKVQGIPEEDYYIEWTLEPRRMVGVVSWIRADHNTIVVSFSAKVPHGVSAFRAELYSRSEQKLLCTRRMNIQCY